MKKDGRNDGGSGGDGILICKTRRCVLTWNFAEKYKSAAAGKTFLPCGFFASINTGGVAWNKKHHTTIRSWIETAPAGGSRNKLSERKCKKKGKKNTRIQ